MMTQSPYIVKAIANGYNFECSCGELYKSVAIARACRKCRTYTEQGRCTAVYDLSKSEFAWEEAAHMPEPKENKVVQSFTFADALTATDFKKLRESLPQ